MSSSGSEMSRRIGAARGELDKLGRVWKHCKIRMSRKLQIFEACVMSKLLYNLHSLCLNTAEIRRLDAFHIKCLRRILKIPPSFYSRVSNAMVLERAHAKAASALLLERQLSWMGCLATHPDEHVLRQSIFQSGQQRLKPRMPEGVKR